MKIVKRDPFDVFCLWTCIGAVTVLAVTIAVAWPLLYLWCVGLLFCVTIGVGTLVFVCNMDPLFLFFFGGEIIKGAFYVIGAILCGLAEASK